MGPIPKRNWKETYTTLRTLPLIVKRFPVSPNRLSSVEVHQLQFFSNHTCGIFSSVFFFHVGLPILISPLPSVITPKEHSTLNETCQAKGFPRPSINWTRLGMPFPAGKTTISGGSLTINNLSPADSGVYECRATNSMGTTKTKMNVAVQRDPFKGLYSLGICLVTDCSTN